MNRVVLIGVAGLLALAAAIALNNWTGRETGDEPVVARPARVSAPSEPAAVEDDAVSSATGPETPREPSEAGTLVTVEDPEAAPAAGASDEPMASESGVGDQAPVPETAALGSSEQVIPQDSLSASESASTVAEPASSAPVEAGAAETAALGPSPELAAQVPVSASASAPVMAVPDDAGDAEIAAVESSTRVAVQAPATASASAPVTAAAAENPATMADEAMEAASSTSDESEAAQTAALESSTRVAAQAPVTASASAPVLAEPAVAGTTEPATNAESPATVEVADTTEPAQGKASVATEDGVPAAEVASAIVLSPESLAVSPQAPSFDVVRVNRRGDAVLAGRAEPDAEVIIHDDGREIGRAMADSHGEWVFVPTEPLPPGSQELSLSARRGEGPEVLSAETVVLVVPGPGTNGDGAVTGGAPTGTLALQMPRADGSQAMDVAPAPTKILQIPSGEELAPDALTLRAVDYSDGGRLVLSGNAPSGARLQVYLDDSLIGVAEVEEGGAWNLVPEGSVEAGVYTMRVDQVDAAGKVISRIELPFARAEPVVALPEETIFVVQPGDSLWRIARGIYGAGIKYTVIYNSNRDQIRDPHVIYPGQIFTLERID